MSFAAERSREKVKSKYCIWCDIKLENWWWNNASHDYHKSQCDKRRALAQFSVELERHMHLKPIHFQIGLLISQWEFLPFCSHSAVAHISIGFWIGCWRQCQHCCCSLYTPKSWHLNGKIVLCSVCGVCAREQLI